jgi:amino acid adenylation domain-containing protein
MKSLSDPAGLSPEKRALLALLLQEQGVGVAAAATIPKRDPAQNAPLSYSQQRLWFLDQLEPDTALYNICRGTRFDGTFDLDLVERAFAEIWRRHEGVRTTFRIQDGEPVQWIASPEAAPKPLHIDLSQFAPAERDAESKRALLELSNHVFDLAAGPLLLYGVVTLSASEHLLVFVMHHIIGDGWSIGILMKEFVEVYQAFSQDLPSPLPELEIQYTDYAVWQRDYLQSAVMEPQLAYWRKQLAGVPEALEFPTDRPRPARQTIRGAYQRMELPRSLLNQLKKVGEKEGATPFMTLLAAFKVLFSRYTGQTDIVIGSPIAGRTRRETEPLIGNFLNTLVLRTDLSGNPTFREQVRRVKETTLNAYSNQEVPFEKLVEELQLERDFSRTPLFQTMFIFQNMPMGLPGRSLIPVGEESAVARYGLSVEVAEGQDCLVFVFEYNIDLFDTSTIERMMGHYARLLEAVCRDSEQRVGEIPFISEDERLELLTRWNNTAADHPADKCLPQLFQSQVECTPDKVAVVCQDKELTYNQLAERSNQLAHFLRSKGVGKGDLVAIMTERSLEMIVALLGVLKTGAAYLPLDPVYPPDRIAFMLHDSSAPVLITQTSLLNALPPSEAQVVCLDRDWEQITKQSVEGVVGDPAPNDLAYVIYTSGSTGQPKGVMIEHRSLVNFLWSMNREPGLSAADALLAVTTLSFDIAGLELYLPLITGARLHVARREDVVDANALHKLLETSGATVMQATPAAWRMLIEAGKTMPRLKVLCGGEALSGELANQVKQHSRELWNMYGPTETTIWSSVYRVDSPQETATVELGHPIGNTQFYVLDDHMGLVPRGVAGELYIGGAGIARGYLNRPELTAQKFVSDPFSGEPDARLYRTGDRVCRLGDGSLHYLERVDNQVKIRGYRIETGDVEAALTKHPLVKQAVVVARQEESTGEKRLVAYVVGKDSVLPGTNGNGDSRHIASEVLKSNGKNDGANGHGLDLVAAMPSAAEWRGYLRELIPEYMVPANFVVLPDLPLTPNGKVDRNRLPSPLEVEAKTDELVGPKDGLELQLVKIWEQVLGHYPIGVRDNFFDLGGHSLLAVRLFMQIEQVFGKSLPLAVLFQAPTIEQLADVLRRQGWTAPWSSLVPLNAGGAKPPFFCVHSLGANLVSYQALAKRMDDDQPFYGLQPLGLDGKQEPHTRIEEMATHYLKEIRAVQPEGPYFLGGVCLGGTIAFEMAQQLHQVGERVALLALIDSYRPGPIEYLPKDQQKSLAFLVDFHIGNLFMRSPRERLDYAREKLSNLSVRLARVSRKLPERMFGVGSVTSIETTLRSVFAANAQGERFYNPQFYPGKITLLWSSATTTRSFMDRRLHWGELAGAGFEVQAIPGDHMTMIEEPYVNVLAGKLQQSIMKGQADFGSLAASDSNSFSTIESGDKGQAQVRNMD